MSDAHDAEQAKPERTRKAPSSTRGGAREPAADGSREHQPCMPCHGSGKVISNLGGHSRKVTCPWCRGGGERLTGVDAQEWQQEQAALRVH
jgi:DnaJ-class molecular chaperone